MKSLNQTSIWMISDLRPEFPLCSSNCWELSMRHIAKTIPVVLFLMLCGPSMKAFQASNNQAAKEAYTHGLAPGDSIEVNLYDFPEVKDAIPVSIAQDGTVHLPYAGTVKIAGLSPNAAAEMIEHALGAKNIVKSANVSIKVVSSSKNVSVNTIYLDSLG